MSLEKMKEHISEKFYDELERDEGITKDDLSLVDLSIQHTPVITHKGGRPVKVLSETQAGEYIIDGYPIPVSKEILTIMRYRYLINR